MSIFDIAKRREFSRKSERLLDWHDCSPPYISRPTTEGTGTRWFKDTERRWTSTGWQYRQLDHYDPPTSY